MKEDWLILESVTQSDNPEIIKKDRILRIEPSPNTPLHSYIYFIDGTKIVVAMPTSRIEGRL